jgi:hypothetical protein
MDGLLATYLLQFLLPLWLVTGPAPARAQEPAFAEAPVPAERRKVVDGIDVVYGIVPAARAVPAHRQNPGGERSHGGTPSGEDVYHLDVALFDAATRVRIANAKVRATVREIGAAGKRKSLDAEAFDKAVSYGNYFTLRGQGPFRIVVEAQLPGRKKAVEAEFEYRTQ